MTEDKIILVFALILLIFGVGFSVGSIEKVPYEQTYEYLFDRVDSYPNHIVRTNYYGRAYITVPLEIKGCGAEDYLAIHQSCKQKYPSYIEIQEMCGLPRKVYPDPKRYYASNNTEFWDGYYSCKERLLKYYGFDGGNE